MVKRQLKFFYLAELTSADKSHENALESLIIKVAYYPNNWRLRDRGRTMPKNHGDQREPN